MRQQTSTTTTTTSTHAHTHLTLQQGEIACKERVHCNHCMHCTHYWCMLCTTPRSRYLVRSPAVPQRASSRGEALHAQQRHDERACSTRVPPGVPYLTLVDTVHWTYAVHAQCTTSLHSSTQYTVVGMVAIHSTGSTSVPWYVGCAAVVPKYLPTGRGAARSNVQTKTSMLLPYGDAASTHVACLLQVVQEYHIAWCTALHPLQEDAGLL